MSTQKKNISNKNKKDEDSKNTVKKTVMFIILIIIIILSLITSCSCTSNFFGRIGNIFRNDGEVDVDNDNKHRVKVKNQDLVFDTKELEISLSDTAAKLSFSYQNIVPKEYSCTTSDASIATCYVSDGYVVINPKKPGKVTVTLSTDTNGKTYIATSDVTIKDSEKMIKLSSKSGTINLAYTKTKSITYSLVGLTGDVTVTSSDDKIATAVADNGTLKITAYRKGSVEITLSVTYNGQLYKTIYSLKVIDDKKVAINKPDTSKPGDNDNMGEGGDTPGESTNPDDPSKPDKPNPPVETKSSNANLKKLSISWFNFSQFDPNVYDYSISLPSWRRSIKVNAEVEDSKAKILSYTFDGQTYSASELGKRLELHTGDMPLSITVQAEDGTIKIYNVLINKPASSNSLLKELKPSIGKFTEEFKKNNLNYFMNVPYNTDKIDFTVTPRSKKATLECFLNGKKVNLTDGVLKDLALTERINTLEIVVTSEDGKSTSTYTTTIKKDLPEGIVDNNTDLWYIKDSFNKINFDKDTHNYTIGVDKDADKISFDVAALSKDATLAFTYNGQPLDDISDLSNLDLNQENNQLVIRVTAPNGNSSVYTVDINKAKEDKSNLLSGIEVKDAGSNKQFDLVPVFSENETNYTVEVDENTNTVNVNAIKQNPDSKVTYTYNGRTLTDPTEINHLDLESDKNILKIDVDGRTYTVNINKKTSLSGDNRLIDLIVNDKTSIINTMRYDALNNETVISLDAIVDNKATYEFFRVGNPDALDKDHITLTEGLNVLSLVVTAENGDTKSYRVEIYREPADIKDDSSIKEFYINNQDMLLDSDLKLDPGKSIDYIYAEANDSDATVSYEYKGKTYDQSEYNTLLENINNDFSKLAQGDSLTVTAVITSKNGTKNPVPATITKNVVPAPVGGLTDLTIEDVNGNDIPLNFDPSVFDYDVKTYENKVILKPVADGDIEYKIGTGEFQALNGSTIAVDLTDGGKYVIIKSVGAEYSVYVHKIRRSIEILQDEDSDICYIEDGSCTIRYVVLEDNEIITQFDINKLNISKDLNGNDSEGIEISKGVYGIKDVGEDGKQEIYGTLTIKPDGSKVKEGDKLNLTLNIGDNITDKITITFVTRLKNIWTYQSIYGIPYVIHGANSKTVIYNTNIFTNAVALKKVSGNGKELTVCTDDESRCLNLTATGPIEIDYNPTKTRAVNDSFKAVPIHVQATGTDFPATGYIQISGTSYGSHIDGPRVQIDIDRGNIVTLKAGEGGQFNAGTTEYEFMLTEKNKTLDISKYIPYKKADKCTAYKFKQYTYEDGTPYVGDSVITYSENASELTLVASYDETDAGKIPLKEDEKVLYVTDIPLFYNEDAVQKYGEKNAKMVYPGANGSYTLEINNKSSNEIEITGLVMSEDNICFDQGSKCLNMAYIVKDQAGSYYLGSGKTLNDKNSKPVYEVLNDLIRKSGSSTYEKSVDGDSNLTIPAGETREVTVFWKWIERDDDVDTRIGNMASENGTVDTLYKLSLGLKYRNILDNECPKN